MRLQSLRYHQMQRPQDQPSKDKEAVETIERLGLDYSHATASFAPFWSLARALQTWVQNSSSRTGGKQSDMAEPGHSGVAGRGRPEACLIGDLECHGLITGIALEIAER
ncbi:hypothetical protein JQ616_29545 [Bradyrhizobium tropiciagri]|uniref:hypothetical protein n=1 Tax=Bradyrhizobium tropiciagri TaxID=312253 RepID=UPI001BA59F11|nr:hypothetical protein [Bradyrhizobium tropiciagri]MBR0899117.1 hypothetical protein [Bradyrhizobium tropiciagri]